MNCEKLPERLQKGISAIQAYGFLKEESDILLRAVPGIGISVEKTEQELIITYDTEPHFYMALVRGLVMEQGKYSIPAKVGNLGLLLAASAASLYKLLVFCSDNCFTY